LLIFCIFVFRSLDNLIRASTEDVALYRQENQRLQDELEYIERRFSKLDSRIQ